MNRAKKLTGILMALGLCMLSGTAILGYWKMTGSSGNILTMASFQNQIEEEYRIPSHVDPGQTVDKIVNVKNTGTADSRIRVKIRKMFGERKADGGFTEDTTLDPEMIQISCNTGYWKLMPDGYYYYTEKGYESETESGLEQNSGQESESESESETESELESESETEELYGIEPYAMNRTPTGTPIAKATGWSAITSANRFSPDFLPVKFYKGISSLDNMK